MTEEGLHHLRRCEQLLSLDLGDLPCVADTILEQLHGTPLVELFLGDSYWTDNVTDQAASRSVSHGRRYYPVSQSREKILPG